MGLLSKPFRAWPIQVLLLKIRLTLTGLSLWFCLHTSVSDIQYNYIFKKPPVCIRHVRLITIRGKYTYKHNISNSDLFGLRVVVWTPNERNTIIIVHWILIGPRQ